MQELSSRIAEAQARLKALADDHADRASQLYDLATLLNDRYSVTSVTDDQNNAIDMVRQAIQAPSHQHPDRPE